MRRCVIRNQKKKLFTILIGVLVTVGCLYYAVSGVNWSDVGQSFKQADYRILPVFLLILAVFYWLKAIRWTYLLRPQKRLKARDVLPTLMIGFMGNNILPMRIGEFLRAFFLARQENLSKVGVLSTLVLERLFDLASILLFLVLGLHFMQQSGIEMPLVDAYILPVTLAVAGLFFIIVIYMIWTQWFISVTETVLKFLFVIPEGIQKKIIELLHVGETGISSLRNPWLTTRIILNSLAQWFLNGVLFAIALHSFGLPASLPVAFVVMGCTAIAVAIPSTPGFFGVIQASFKIALIPLGVSDEAALSCSIYYHLGQWIPVTIIGFFFLHRMGLNLGDLGKSVEANSNDDETDENS